MHGPKLTGVIVLAALLAASGVADARVREAHGIKNPRIQSAMDSFMRHNRKHLAREKAKADARNLRH